VLVYFGEFWRHGCADAPADATVHVTLRDGVHQQPLSRRGRHLVGTVADLVLAGHLQRLLGPDLAGIPHFHALELQGEVLQLRADVDGALRLLLLHEGRPRGTVPGFGRVSALLG